MDQNKIRLIWVIDSLGHGGAERLTVPILGNLDHSQFDIRVCALQSRNNNPIAQELEALGLDVDTLGIKVLRDPVNLVKLLRYFITHQPDIIHTQLQFADTLGPLAARLLGIPSVSTQHTIEGFEPKSKGARRQKVTWFILRNFSNRVITVSEKTREYHLKAGKLAPNRTLTLYNGIRISRFASPTSSARDKTRIIFGIPTKSFVITTVAVLREQKGVGNMVAALPKLIKAHEDLIYLIVGDGDHRAALEQQIDSLGLNQKVILAGQRTNIPEILAASDLFVLPTLTDALPTVLFEAQAARLPIVASNVGGIPEIVSNGHDGSLVPPRDIDALAAAINDLISSPQKRETFANNGYEVVEARFNISVQVEKLTQLYLEVLNGNN